MINVSRVWKLEKKENGEFVANIINSQRKIIIKSFSLNTIESEFIDFIEFIETDHIGNGDCLPFYGFSKEELESVLKSIETKEMLPKVEIEKKLSFTEILSYQKTYSKNETDKFYNILKTQTKSDLSKNKMFELRSFMYTQSTESLETAGVSKENMLNFFTMRTNFMKKIYN